ncbi:keratinocyte proline-rich protein-like [Ammospiza nelsoni]|uniref:keratinocyte proline-rich protein-like n=1 Tax=Ammospiza nelsoni TaxID=2857394 RepID=UPI00286AA23D|nr:keratinocyte proline-rich protein-like [Ammospiza nelsoni]
MPTVLQGMGSPSEQPPADSHPCDDVAPGPWQLGQHRLPGATEEPSPAWLCRCWHRPPALRQRPERLLRCPQPGHRVCHPALPAVPGPVPAPCPARAQPRGPPTARRPEQVPVAILGSVVKMPLLLLIMSLLFKCIHWSCASPLRQQAWRSLPGVSCLHRNPHTCPLTCPHPCPLTCPLTCPHPCPHPALARAPSGLSLRVRGAVSAWLGFGHFRHEQY